MKVSPQLVIGILQFVWPLVEKDLKEQAEKTGTPWDDRAIQLVGLLLGHVDPSMIGDREALLGYLLRALKEADPEFLKDKDRFITEVKVALDFIQ